MLLHLRSGEIPQDMSENRCRRVSRSYNEHRIDHTSNSGEIVLRIRLIAPYVGDGAIVDADSSAVIKHGEQRKLLKEMRLQPES